MAARHADTGEDAPKHNEFLEWILVIAIAIGCALAFRTFVAEVYEVPSGSMLDTIQIGDRLVGEKVSYHFTSPKQGDIVTFIDPEDHTTTLIKRVIATAGQTVEFKDGIVYVDGEALDEPYTEGKPTEPLSMQAASVGSIEYPYTVPDGCVWVMGDNRTNSLDSRYFGPIEVSSITSHGLFIFWPLSDAGSL
ncbi:MAG: signal peptidase I [Atopobiaceae bacterium]